MSHQRILHHPKETDPTRHHERDREGEGEGRRGHVRQEAELMAAAQRLLPGREEGAEGHRQERRQDLERIHPPLHSVRGHGQSPVIHQSGTACHIDDRVPRFSNVFSMPH